MSAFLIYVCVAGLFYFTRCFYLMEIKKDEETLEAFGPLKYKRNIIYVACLLFGFVLLPIEIVWEICEACIKSHE